MREVLVESHALATQSIVHQVVAVISSKDNQGFRRKVALFDIAGKARDLVVDHAECPEVVRYVAPPIIFRVGEVILLQAVLPPRAAPIFFNAGGPAHLAGTESGGNMFQYGVGTCSGSWGSGILT